MNILKLILWVPILVSCAQVTGLNLKKHQFGKIPSKIIWIQVAGLSQEHLSLLKFSYSSRSKQSAFEKSSCIGSSWEYNLYKLRPSAYSGFMSQMSGKKNIKDNCSDYSQTPLWKYLEKNRYKVGLFEGPSKYNQSLLQSKKCDEGHDYMKNTTYWGMNNFIPTTKTFHADEVKTFEKGQIYLDKSCKGPDCFSTYSRNASQVFEAFSKNTNNYLFIVRNFSYMNYLKNNDLSKAKEELSEINDTLSYFQDKSKKNSNMLVLFTSAEPQDISFPKSGKEWTILENESRGVKLNNTKLMNTIYVLGARSENFCGLYEQDEILKRIFTGNNNQGLEFSFDNPF